MSINESLSAIDQVSAWVYVPLGRSATWTISSDAFNGHVLIERGPTPAAFGFFRRIDGNGGAMSESNQIDGEGYYRFRLAKRGDGESIAVAMALDAQDEAGDDGEANTASNVGDGEGEVFRVKSGVNLQMRTLKAGSNMQIETQDTVVVISAVSGVAGEVNTASSVGVGHAVFFGKSGVDLRFKTLEAGSNVTITDDGAGTLTIASTAAGEANVGDNLGTGTGIYAGKTGTALNLKSLVAGTGVNITSDANHITIESPGTGEINFGENLGAGTVLYAGKSGANLQFKTLLAGAGISLSNDANTVTITSTATGAGEVNTLSSEGTGTSLVRPKVGADLRIKSLAAGAGIAITDNGNGTVTIDGGSAGSNVSLADVTVNATGAVSRDVRAQIIDSGMSILSFGADPTGVAACDTALRNAIDSGLTRKIIFPEGIFRFNNTILLDESIELIGAHRTETELRSYVTGSNHGMRIIGNPDLGRSNLIKIRDMRLHYAGAGQTVASGRNNCWSGVYIQRGIRFENFYVSGFTNDGMYFAPSDASEGATSVLGSIDQSVFFAEMRHSWSKDNGRDGIRVRAGANANYFVNCQFDRNKGVGFHHMTDGYATYGNVLIIGQASYNSSYGYYFESGTDLWAAGLYAERNGTPTNTDTNSYLNTPYDFFIGDNTSRSHISLGTVFGANYTHVRAPTRGLNEGCMVTHGGFRIYGSTVYRVPTRASAVANLGASPTNAEIATAFNALLTQLRNGNMIASS